MGKYRKYRNALIEDLRDASEEQAYLAASFEAFEQDSDAEALMLALRTVAEAQGGVPKLARRIGMEKMTLYKALPETGNPTLGTLEAILHGLGYKLTLAPTGRPKASLSP